MILQALDLTPGRKTSSEHSAAPFSSSHRLTLSAGARTWRLALGSKCGVYLWTPKEAIRGFQQFFEGLTLFAQSRGQKVNLVQVFLRCDAGLRAFQELLKLKRKDLDSECGDSCCFRTLKATKPWAVRVGPKQNEGPKPW